MIDIFTSTESNSGCTYENGRCSDDHRNKLVSVELPTPTTSDEIRELIETLKSQRVLSKGSSRSGPFEIQTDDGIWNRTGTQKTGTWSFKTWDEIEI